MIDRVSPGVSMPEDGRFDHESMSRTGLPEAVHQALQPARLSLRAARAAQARLSRAA
jgi:hypothetical protein